MNNIFLKVYVVPFWTYSSRNANGFSKQPQNQRKLNTKYGVECSPVQCEPINRNPCSVILKICHCPKKKKVKPVNKPERVMDSTYTSYCSFR